MTEKWKLRAVALSSMCSPMKISQLLLSDGINVSSETIRNYLLTIGIRPVVESNRHASKIEEEIVEEIDDTMTQTLEVDRNTASVQLTGNLVVNIDDMKSKCNIDEETWIIDSYEQKAWTTTMKIKKQSGHGQYTKIWYEPQQIQNYGVSAKLLRRIPEDPEWPIIAPVHLHEIKREEHDRSYRKHEIAVIVPDMHIGFWRDLDTGKLETVHSRESIDIIMSVIKDIKPDRIIFVGDILDLPDMSTKYIVSPEMMFTTQASIIEGAWWIRQARLLAPSAKIDILEGNHDTRITRAIQTNQVSAYGLKPADAINGPPLMSVPYLLCFSASDVNYIDGYPNNSIYINDTLRVRHGTGGGWDPYKYLSKHIGKSMVSEIFGHVHKLAKIWNTDYSKVDKPQTRYAASVGCLAKIDGKIPKASDRPNWQNGFAIVEYSQGMGFHHTELIEIKGGCTYYRGIEYNGIDRRDEIYLSSNYYAFKE